MIEKMTAAQIKSDLCRCNSPLHPVVLVPLLETTAAVSGSDDPYEPSVVFSLVPWCPLCPPVPVGDLERVSYMTGSPGGRCS